MLRECSSGFTATIAFIIFCVAGTTLTVLEDGAGSMPLDTYRLFKICSFVPSWSKPVHLISYPWCAQASALGLRLATVQLLRGGVRGPAELDHGS